MLASCPCERRFVAPVRPGACAPRGMCRDDPGGGGHDLAGAIVVRRVVRTSCTLWPRRGDVRLRMRLRVRRGRGPLHGDVRDVRDPMPPGPRMQRVRRALPRRLRRGRAGLRAAARVPRVPRAPGVVPSGRSDVRGRLLLQPRGAGRYRACIGRRLPRRALRERAVMSAPARRVRLLIAILPIERRRGHGLLRGSVAKNGRAIGRLRGA